MKRIAIFVCALALTLSMSMNAFAAESDQTASSQGDVKTKVTAVHEKVGEKKAELQQKKADNSAFREAVKEKRDVVKENREKNKAVGSENKTLRKSLAEKLKAVKDGEITLDADTAAKLNEYNTELKAATAELKSTRGQIKEIALANKDNIKARDYEAMEAAFDKIGDIQKARYEELTKINELLNNMLALF